MSRDEREKGFDMNYLIEIDNSHHSQSDTQSGSSVVQDDSQECNLEEGAILSVSELINYVKKIGGDIANEKGKELSVTKDVHPIKVLIKYILNGGKLRDLFKFNHLKSIFLAFIKVNSDELIFKRSFNREGRVVFVGDIHGHLESLDQVLFNIYCCDFIFLGDYVDRGDYQLECLIFIYLLKIFSPNHVILLRGNHEAYPFDESQFLNICISMKLSYLEDEKITDIQELAFNSFDYLDICLVFNDEFFCVHGGITSNFHILKGLDKMKKPFKFNHQSIDEDTNSVLELLWNDPKKMDFEFTCNYERGDGCKYFNEETVNNFFNWFRNESKDEINLKLVIRGHQTEVNGYGFRLPNVLTVFSACDYIESGDMASYLICYKGKLHVITFYRDEKSKEFVINVIN